MIDRSVLSKSYFTSDKIVRHHVDSFNAFLELGLQKVIDEQSTIETDIEGTHIRLGTIRMGHPVVREADGAVDKLYPTEARLRNITYAAPLYLGMTIVTSEGEKEEKDSWCRVLDCLLEFGLVTGVVGDHKAGHHADEQRFGKDTDRQRP